MLSDLFIALQHLQTFAQNEIVTADSTKNKALLWQISGKNLSKPSYIYGTIHVIEKKDFFMSQNIKQKFEETDQLVLEIPMDMSLSQKIEMAQKIMLPNQKTIKDYTSKTDFECLQNYMTDTLQINPKKQQRLIRLKPFFLMATLEIDKIKKTKSYEKVFAKMAKKQRKTVVGLETADFQLSIIDRYPYTLQAKMLIDGIKQSTNDQTLFEEMVAVYKSQDIEKLYQLIKKESDTMPNFEQYFLTERNLDWIPKIEKIIQHQPVFIAVGAGHLGGEQGMVNLLRQNGYTLTPIR